MITTPSTELDAINEMLTTIGESPVSTVDDNGVVDAAIARQILTSVNRSVQSKGWHFNTERNYKISPSYPLKELVLSPDVLQIDTVREDFDKNLVQRGNRLYDVENHTYKFDEPVHVDMVVNLEFDVLPEAARYYISIRAARIFQERTLGSTTLSGFSERDEIMAKVALEEAVGETADANILTDSWAVARVLDRSPH